MTEAYTFPADRLEEVECPAVVDVLRRSGVEVTLVSATEDRKVTGSHGIELGADALSEDVSPDAANVLFLLGGMPGTNSLKAYMGLRVAVERANKQGRRIAAICAAPSIPGSTGLLKGKMATCYLGLEDQLTGVSCISQGVVTDGNITTGKGLGSTFDMELELIRLLQDPQQIRKIVATIQYNWKWYPGEESSCSALYHMGMG